MQRIIGLLDLDYFYAQCEQLRNPAFRGKPVVIVMPSLRENSGAIATCNYEARAMKIRSGMPLSLAKKLASKETVFINADKQYYEELSQKVFEVVDFFCENVEQVSIDEAYFDLSNPSGFDKAIELCEKIKARIAIELGLTCSIGVGPNKLIAKMACGVKKPNGFFAVKPEEVQRFLSKQRVGALFGVGPKGEEIFSKHHVHFVADILKHSREELVAWFGEVKGIQFHDFARGEDARAVEPNREKQQLSRMLTLKQDSSDFDFIKPSVDFLSELVFTEVGKFKKHFKTVSVVIITERMETLTKSKTKLSPIASLEEIREISYELLRNYLSESISRIRRLGVRVSNFDEQSGMQRKLFEF